MNAYSCYPPQMSATAQSVSPAPHAPTVQPLMTPRNNKNRGEKRKREEFESDKPPEKIYNLLFVFVLDFCPSANLIIFLCLKRKPKTKTKSGSTFVADF